MIGRLLAKSEFARLPIVAHLEELSVGRSVVSATPGTGKTTAVPPALAVIWSETVGECMDFDNDILIRLYWRGTPLVWIDTSVRYTPGGVSHFHAWHDNLLISKMHARLFCRMLARRLGLRP